MNYKNSSLDHSRTLLSLGQVARMLKISPSTLRTYELEGLVTPSYRRGRKGYSYEHINWISCMRFLIQDKGISIPGLTRLLKLAPCWEIANCSCETKTTCKARTFTYEYLKEGSSRTPSMMDGIFERIPEKQLKGILDALVLH